MFACLEIMEYDPKGFVERLLGALKKPNVSSEIRSAYGSDFLRIQADAGRKGVQWQEVAHLGQQAAFLLLPEGTELPEEFVQPEFPSFARAVLRKTACTLIARSKMPMYRRVLGLYDPAGRYADLLDELLKHYTAVRVVTDEHALYSEAADEMMERYGAPVLVGGTPDGFADCVLILAPEGFDPPASFRCPCPVLDGSDRPTFSGRHDVFSCLRVVPRGPDGKQVPPGISHHRFAGALYEHHGVELSGLIAERLSYNLKNAALSEAVYAVLRNAGYPSGL